jgi:hypothetical protein
MISKFFKLDAQNFRLFFEVELDEEENESKFHYNILSDACYERFGASIGKYAETGRYIKWAIFESTEEEYESKSDNFERYKLTFKRSKK